MSERMRCLRSASWRRDRSASNWVWSANRSSTAQVAPAAAGCQPARRSAPRTVLTPGCGGRRRLLQCATAWTRESLPRSSNSMVSPRTNTGASSATSAGTRTWSSWASSPRCGPSTAHTSRRAASSSTCRPRARASCRVRARTRAWWTSAAGWRWLSRWRAITTPATSSRTRGRPPASGASSATCSPWARGRSPRSTLCASGSLPIRRPLGCSKAWSPASPATGTASACRPSAARWPSTRATTATAWSTPSRWDCSSRTASSAAPRRDWGTRSSTSARAPAATAFTARPWPPPSSPRKGREREVFEICDKWDLAHAVVARVTDTGKLVVKSEGKTVAELPIAPLTHEAPSYDRPRRRPEWLDDARKLDLAQVPEPRDLAGTLKQVLASPTVASKEWVYRQYDHMVRIGTTVRPGQGDAAVVRFTGQREGGVALSVDCNSRYCYLDPRLGAAHAVAEAARNVSCVGGEPLAITDCLNFGNPERPEIMWQFEQACLGIADACNALGTPVVSGNVSLYNETEGKGIFPTPTIGMVGLMEDCGKNALSAFLAAGDRVGIVGGTGNGHLGGSEYLKAVHGLVAGMPPPLDLASEKAVQKAVRESVREGLLKAAHDCS